MTATGKGLTEALNGCAAGDVLVGWKLDRLARSLHDLVVIAEDLKGRGVGLKILRGEGAAVDTTQPQGRMIFGILAVMAEFERELISERTVAGMQAAKRRGQHLGRPAKLTEYQRREAASMLEDNKSCCALANGARVVSLPGDPDTLRGYSAPKLINTLAPR